MSPETDPAAISHSPERLFDEVTETGGLAVRNTTVLGAPADPTDELETLRGEIERLNHLETTLDRFAANCSISAYLSRLGKQKYEARNAAVVKQLNAEMTDARDDKQENSDQAKLSYALYKGYDAKRIDGELELPEDVDTDAFNEEYKQFMSDFAGLNNSQARKDKSKAIKSDIAAKQKAIPQPNLF